LSREAVRSGKALRFADRVTKHCAEKELFSRSSTVEDVLSLQQSSVRSSRRTLDHRDDLKVVWKRLGFDAFALARKRKLSREAVFRGKALRFEDRVAKHRAEMKALSESSTIEEMRSVADRAAQASQDVRRLLVRDIARVEALISTKCLEKIAARSRQFHTIICRIVSEGVTAVEADIHSIDDEDFRERVWKVVHFMAGVLCDGVVDVDELRASVIAVQASEFARELKPLVRLLERKIAEKVIEHKCPAFFQNHVEKLAAKLDEVMTSDDVEELRAALKKAEACKASKVLQPRIAVVEDVLSIVEEHNKKVADAIEADLQEAMDGGDIVATRLAIEEAQKADIHPDHRERILKRIGQAERRIASAVSRRQEGKELLKQLDGVIVQSGATVCDQTPMSPAELCDPTAMLDCQTAFARKKMQAIIDVKAGIDKVEAKGSVLRRVAMVVRAARFFFLEKEFADGLGQLQESLSVKLKARKYDLVAEFAAIKQNANPPDVVAVRGWVNSVQKAGLAIELRSQTKQAEKMIAFLVSANYNMIVKKRNIVKCITEKMREHGDDAAEMRKILGTARSSACAAQIEDHIARVSERLSAIEVAAEQQKRNRAAAKPLLEMAFHSKDQVKMREAIFFVKRAGADEELAPLIDKVRKRLAVFRAQSRAKRKHQRKLAVATMSRALEAAASSRDNMSELRKAIKRVADAGLDKEMRFEVNRAHRVLALRRLQQIGRERHSMSSLKASLNAGSIGKLRASVLAAKGSVYFKSLTVDIRRAENLLKRQESFDRAAKDLRLELMRAVKGLKHKNGLRELRLVLYAVKTSRHRSQLLEAIADAEEQLAEAEAQQAALKANADAAALKAERSWLVSVVSSGSVPELRAAIERAEASRFCKDLAPQIKQAELKIAERVVASLEETMTSIDKQVAAHRAIIEQVQLAKTREKETMTSMDKQLAAHRARIEQVRLARTREKAAEKLAQFDSPRGMVLGPPQP